MKRWLILSLVALTACATPQERCINDAAAPYRAALKERQQIAQALARGFVYKTDFERRQVFTRCKLSQDRTVPCWDTETVPVTRKIAVDARVLRQRDAQLARDLPGLERAAQAGAQVCRGTIAAG